MSSKIIEANVDLERFVPVIRLLAEVGERLARFLQLFTHEPSPRGNR